jgi:hypothetical protein
MNSSRSRKTVAVGGLVSALGLLAETAPAQVISFNPGTPYDTGWGFVPGLSWDPFSLNAVATNNFGSIYPGIYTMGSYGCFGYMELSTAGGTEVGAATNADGYAPRFATGNSIGPTNNFNSESSASWLATIDTNGYTWGDHFFVGYRVTNPVSGYNYGYAELSVNWDGDSWESIQLYGWAYESTPDTPIVAGAIPEPGTCLLLLCGAVAAFFRRRRRP